MEPVRDLATALEALQQGRAFRPRDAGDRLLVHGADALDLFHRIAASEVRDLEENEVRPVLFTDDKGRVVDLPQLLRGDEHLELFCTRGRGPELRAWIERWVITEEVVLEPGGPSWDLFGGPALDAAAHAVGLARPRPSTCVADDGAFLAHAVRPAGTPALLAVRDPGRAETLATAALAQDLTTVDAVAVDAWCVRLGRVLGGPALSTRANPLELGWKGLVSWTKGCYIGQEVVARLDTYEKVKRRVVAVRGEGATPEPGTALQAEGRRAGEILLAARLDEGTALLAVVEKSLQEGARVAWDEGAGTVSTIPAP